MELKHYTDANRRSWNQVASRHHEGKQKRKEQFEKEGYSVLDELVTEKLTNYNIRGKHVAHLCCNDGLETLSLKNLGAASCTGFDISDNAIKEARKLASFAKVDCEFVRTDVYEIPEEYNAKFDIVYISSGSLIWFPDLELFFKTVSRLLKTGGIVMIYDIHPVLFMLDENDEKHPLRLSLSYFIDEPRIYNEGLDYVNKQAYDSEPYYVFDPTLSQIITAILKGGLNLELFEEYDHDISALYEHLDNQEVRIPKSYILVARNPRVLDTMKGE